MIWAEMDYDDRLAAIVTLARDGNALTMIARVLGTSNENVWHMARDHGVSIPTTRPGHAIPDPADEGLGGGDQFSRRLLAWRRASQGARATRLANENASRTNSVGMPVDGVERHPISPQGEV